MRNKAVLWPSEKNNNEQQTTTPEVRAFSAVKVDVDADSDADAVADADADTAAELSNNV